MIERLLTPGSILELAMRRFVLGKDTLRLFLIVAKQSTCCAAHQPNERFANTTQKRVICFGVDRQM